MTQAVPCAPERLFALEQTSPHPLRIVSVELLRSGDLYFVRARSTDGAEGLALANSRVSYLYPILLQLVAPYFIGQDARDLEALVDGV